MRRLSRTASRADAAGRVRGGRQGRQGIASGCATSSCATMRSPILRPSTCVPSPAGSCSAGTPIRWSSAPCSGGGSTCCGYSRRDQLSVLIAARAEGLDIAVHEVDTHLSEYHEWPRGAPHDPCGTCAEPLGPDEYIDELRNGIEAMTLQVDRSDHARGPDRERRRAEPRLIAQSRQRARRSSDPSRGGDTTRPCGPSPTWSRRLPRGSDREEPRTR